MNKDKDPESLMKDRGKLIELIYRLLDDILKATVDMPRGSSKFHAKTIPNSPVHDYLQRTVVFI